MFIDVSKFIAITLVCIGHVLCNFQSDFIICLYIIDVKDTSFSKY